METDWIRPCCISGRRVFGRLGMRRASQWSRRHDQLKELGQLSGPRLSRSGRGQTQTPTVKVKQRSNTHPDCQGQAEVKHRRRLSRSGRNNETPAVKVRQRSNTDHSCQGQAEVTDPDPPQTQGQAVWVVPKILEGGI